MGIAIELSKIYLSPVCFKKAGPTGRFGRMRRLQSDGGRPPALHRFELAQAADVQRFSAEQGAAGSRAEVARASAVSAALLQPPGRPASLADEVRAGAGLPAEAACM